MNFTKDEILQILKANHQQRIQIDKGLPPSSEIQYTITIQEWMDEFDLLDWSVLAKYYSDLFQISYSETAWKKVMIPEEEKTLSIFCEYVASKAKKRVIQPIKLFGRDCQEASIFKYLKIQLIKRNKAFINIRPSTKLEAYMNHFAFDLIEEVNLLSTKALPTLTYEENALEKEAWKPIGLSLAVLFCVDLLEANSLVTGMAIGVFTVGLWMIYHGTRLPPKKIQFEKITTFRDLIYSIQQYT